MIETLLYGGERFALKEFRCPAGDELWRHENTIGRWPLAAFPLTSVVIRHEGREPALANPNHVVFYRGGESYRRALHDERGDHCLFVGFDEALAASLLASAGVAGSEFPFALGPSAARSYLRLRLAATAARSGNVDPLAVEEAVCTALTFSVDAAVSLQRVRRSLREATEAEHTRIVEGAKLVLTERATRRDSLSEIARTLHTSEFHLARVFRARTGYTLHAYRTHLRLRAALERLPGRGDLTALARELGFTSHSHLTDTFRAVFGLTPSKVREHAARRGRAELRRILEAPAQSAS